MVTPAALVIVGVITGIGGAVTFATFRYVNKITQNGMERMGRGQTVSDLLPMPPEQGPPLPRVLALRWPWKK